MLLSQLGYLPSWTWLGVRCTWTFDTNVSVDVAVTVSFIHHRINVCSICNPKFGQPMASSVCDVANTHLYLFIPVAYYLIVW